MTSNAELFSAAQAVIPGGVDSPVRAYGSVGGVPRFIEKAQGPWIWDAEGTRYVDLVCTWGPALLGHARPEVVSAVQVAASKGLSFGAPTRTETELADAIIERMAPVEKGFAQAFPAVRWILLVSLAITLKGTVDGVAEGAKEG